jgi:hypothetical protein
MIDAPYPTNLYKSAESYATMMAFYDKCRADLPIAEGGLAQPLASGAAQGQDERHHPRLSD